jgi:hypothetical protein
MSKVQHQHCQDLEHTRLHVFQVEDMRQLKHILACGCFSPSPEHHDSELLALGMLTALYGMKGGEGGRKSVMVRVVRCNVLADFRSMHTTISSNGNILRALASWLSPNDPSPRAPPNSEAGTASSIPSIFPPSTGPSSISVSSSESEQEAAEEAGMEGVAAAVM